MFVRSQSYYAEERDSLARWRHSILGRIRGTLKREPLLNPLLALLNKDLIQRVFIPKGPPNPIPYLSPKPSALNPKP